LAHNDAQAATLAFRQANSCVLQLSREEAEKNVPGGMEAKRRSNQIDKRRSGLQFDSWEISVAIKITPFQMTADAKPTAGGLQREVNGFAGF
jgi:hypothetical protein